MAYTNSSLVTYKNISKNKTSPRNHAIDTITIHCIVGQWTAKQGCDYFATTDRECSSNYIVGKDGSIGLSVAEKDRSWCSSSSSNDHRAITIEVASDTSAPYAVTDEAYNALITLCADICKRNGINQLLWKADKSLIGQVDKQNMSVHRWFANKSCPGDYLYERHGDIAAAVNKLLVTNTGMQASDFKDLDYKDIIAKVGPLFTTDQKNTGVLASVSLAQFILESGYGKSELALNANNCFGMKKSLSGNTWNGSSWDGISIYTKETKEQNADGSYETITADFRMYTSVEFSIADHSAYLLGAKNGTKLRYDGIKGITDYKAVAQLLKDGGYATSLTYVDKLCSIIETWNLTQYDVIAITPTTTYYRVRKTWSDAKSQLGAYKVLANAKKIADANPGYYVFDDAGTAVYPTTQISQTTALPYLVNVSIKDLNIRSGPGTNYGRTGSFTCIGTFTIVEVKAGQGATAGWGKLKSGAGWISLDYAKRV